MNITKTSNRIVFLKGITCGSLTGMALPDGVTRSMVKRVWLVMNEQRIHVEGLRHGVTAFLQDQGHDWKYRAVRDKVHLVFFGNAEYQKPCDLVLECIDGTK